MGLIEIFKTIDKEVFTQSEISGSDFEDIFEQKLIDEGYLVVNIEIDKSLKKLILSSNNILTNSFNQIGYVREPFNTQSFPDYLVLEQNYIIPIELKTSKDTDKPMWNNSIPKQEAIYVFMAYANVPKKREVLFFKGSDVITKEATDTLMARLIEAQQASKFTKEELDDLDIYGHGWNIYVRSNFQQSKHTSETVTSFVDHPNKELNKQKVIIYLETLLAKQQQVAQN